MYFKLSVFLFFFLAFAGLAAGQSLQETTRQYVLEKLVFYYVDDPTQTKPADISTLEIDKTAISNGQDIASPLWTNANNAGLKNLLIEMLRPVSQGGNFQLQKMLRNVLLISNKKVYVYLYGDFSNGANHASWEVYCNTSGYGAAHSNASWPCASYFSDRTQEASGHIGIGAYFFHASRTAGGWSTREDKGTVFIHELVHTQLPLVLESDLGTTPMYGSDWVSHSFDEMIPSRNSAFNEGIANAFGFRYNLPAGLGMSAWFRDNNRVFVDNIAGCSASPTPVKCLQARLTAASVSTQTPCAAGAACYSIRDVPASILMHCENVTANILFQYMQQFRSDLILVRDIKRAVASMASPSNYTFAPLFKEMVKSGMNFSNPANPSGTVTHGQHVPLAILDFYTGFRLDSKTTLEQLLGTTWAATDTNIEDYFSHSNQRRIFLGFRNDANDWDVSRQISAFSEHLHVRTPSRSAAVGEN